MYFLLKESRPFLGDMLVFQGVHIISLPKKLTYYLKMDAWNTILSFWDEFSGAFAVSFREGHKFVLQTIYILYIDISILFSTIRQPQWPRKGILPTR